MPRVVKKPEERKKELTSAALKLFLTKGYEETSVRDIYTEVNGSFGMFYHHFEAKEAIFEAAMGSYTSKFVGGISAIAHNNSLSFKEKYPQLIGLYTEFLGGVDKVCGYKRKDLDRNVFKRLSSMVLSESIPVIKKLIEEGRDEGVLHFDDAETTTTFLLYGIYGMIQRQSVAETNHRNAGDLLRKLTPFIAKLLGADAAKLRAKNREETSEQNF